MRRVLTGVCAAALMLGAGVAMAQSGSDQNLQDQSGIQGQDMQGQSGFESSGQGQSGEQQGLQGQTQAGQSQGVGLSGSQGAQQYLGHVKSVDLQKHELTLTVPIAPDAQIMRNGHQASLNEIKQGDDVRVDFQPTSQGVTQIQAQSKEMKKQMQPKSQTNQ